MDIIIPSSGRPDKQTTVASLPVTLLKYVDLLIPSTEVPQYWHHSARVRVVPCPVKGIGPTRQFVIDNYGPKVVMLDDDLVFATRREDEPAKFRDATDSEVEELFDSIDFLLDDYPHVGVATREGGNHNTNDHVKDTRMLRILAYRTDVLRREGIRFDRLPVMEDFDVTLSLLRRGYSNCVINYMVQNQNGSGLKGGCSQYRTMEMQAEAAYALKALHPEFVNVVEKQTKTAWGGGTRTDVRIQWKKARESAGATKLLD